MARQVPISLRALNASVLLTSDTVVSGELAEELLSGLDEAGAMGLALVQERIGDAE